MTKGIKKVIHERDKMKREHGRHAKWVPHLFQSSARPTFSESYP